MKDFTWILLSIGLATLIVLLIKPLWLNKRHHSKIKISNKFVINNNELHNDKPNQVIALRFSPKVKSNIPLDEVMKLLVRHKLSFTSMKIFEKKHRNKKLFNVANLIEPGIFVENEDIPGFTFFFQQTDPKTDLSILSEMFETMRELCQHYDAWILDDNGKNIDRSNLNSLLNSNE